MYLLYFFHKNKSTKSDDCRSKVIMSPHTKVEMSPLWYTVRLFTNHTVYDIYHYVYKRIGSFDRN